MNVEEGETAGTSRRSVWREVMDAIRGTEADYTRIPLKRAIFLLAIPMVLELVLESTFALADIYFVGKLGSSAIATVGLTETYLFLLYSVAMGLAMAVTAIVSRRVGEKNPEAAGRVATQSIFLAIIVSLPFSVAGIFFSKELLALMGGDDWTINHGYKFTQWMLGGNVVIVMLFVINAIFRGAGDAAVAMKVLLISNSINILLVPLFIFGLGPVPAMGIEGAAIATTTGRGCGVLVQLWLLFKGSKHIKAGREQLIWDTHTMLSIAKTSVGGIGQNIVSMTSWIFLMRIISDVGSHAVAACTITIRIMMFSMMPAWGLSNAAATLVGQNLGAGHPKRAESSVWRIGVYNMVFLVLVSIAFYVFNDQLLRIFTDDEAVVSIGAQWLRILSFSYFVYGWWMVSVQAFNGAGDTRTPTYINLVFFWAIQIPLCYWLAIEKNWQHSGVFWGVFISETSVGLFTLWLFTRGKWKKTVV